MSKLQGFWEDLIEKDAPYVWEEDVIWRKKLNENVAYRQVLNYTGVMEILKNTY